MKNNKTTIIVSIAAFSLIVIVILTILYFSGAFKTFQTPAKVCHVGGCSAELCLEDNDKNTSSICIWSDKFACYKLSKCEVQQNGKCGWTPNTDFNKCLIDKSSAPILK
jgi:hypothetical protein